MSKFKTLKAKSYHDTVYFLNIPMKIIENLCIKKMLSIFKSIFLWNEQEFSLLI